MDVQHDRRRIGSAPDGPGARRSPSRYGRRSVSPFRLLA
jgi:hypothetical protein